MLTTKTNRTVARIAVDSIDTVGLITLAGVTPTFINTLGAVEPCETIRAEAGVLASSRFACAVAASCIDAGVIQVLTVFTCIPHWFFGAKAHVVAKVVETRAAVVARRR